VFIKLFGGVMKRYFVIPLVITLFLSSATVFAGVNKTVNTNAVVDNLMVGLQSENLGVRVSSAYVLGQLISTNVIEADDASETIIPLMKIMNSEENDEARIVAALALYQLKSERGISLLKYAGEKDKSPRFSRIGTTFYLAHLKRLLSE
jgi:HEAT repeat protein